MSAAASMAVAAMLAIWTFAGIVLVFWIADEYCKRKSTLGLSMDVGLFYVILTIMLIGIMAG